jgi:hypothetical protein
MHLLEKDNYINGLSLSQGACFVVSIVFLTNLGIRSAVSNGTLIVLGMDR